MNPIELIELEQIDVEPNVRILRRMAQLSNFLAKQLTGPRRSLAYRIKAEACSSLILNGRATVNGVWPGGILALDIFGGPPMRLHIRRSHLRPEALTAIGFQEQSIPVVSRLSDRGDGPLLGNSPENSEAKTKNIQ